MAAGERRMVWARVAGDDEEDEARLDCPADGLIADLLELGSLRAHTGGGDRLLSKAPLSELADGASVV
eukprot:gene35981-47955_t